MLSLIYYPILRKILTPLELGCGIGNHIDYEDLEFQNYHVVDIRTNVLNEVKKKKYKC